jgi:hypothetical protein
MKILTTIGQAVLYLFIISSGLQMGAAVFETLVVTPLWSGSLPESVTNWNLNTQYHINPGAYWTKGTLFYSICTLLMLIFAWFMPKAPRNLT